MHQIKLDLASHLHHVLLTTPPIIKRSLSSHGQDPRQDLIYHRAKLSAALVKVKADYGERANHPNALNLIASNWFDRETQTSKDKAQQQVVIS